MAAITPGKLTNFPNGVSSFGIPLFGGGGVASSRTGKARFVCNRSGMPAGNGQTSTYPYSTLAAACGDSAMVANTGQQIHVLEGHSESTATTVLTGLTAGTTIIGYGTGSARPTIRLTNTAAQLAISVANVTFENILFRLEGANGIVKAINVTGADCTFINCEFEVASGAALKSTIAIEFGTGADRFKMINCRMRGTATHNVTDGVKIAGAVDQGLIIGLIAEFSATAANGLIHVTGAATSLQIAYCLLHNTHTSSTATVAVDDVASTGQIPYVSSTVESNGTAANEGVVFAGVTTTKIRTIQTFTSDEPGKSGALAPAVVAT